MTEESVFASRVLPSLSDWLREKCELLGTDLLVPVETKGARLLDEVLRYWRDHDGTTPNWAQPPVVYRHALPFLSNAFLSSRRLLAFDDSTHSGRSLHLLKDAAVEAGARSVALLAYLCTTERTSPHQAMIEAFNRVPVSEHKPLVHELISAFPLDPPKWITSFSA